MINSLERQLILSQSAATAGYDPERCVLDIEYYNGLVYRYFDVSPQIGSMLFAKNRFDKVLRTQVVRQHEYKLIEKLYPVYLG